MLDAGGGGGRLAGLEYEITRGANQPGITATEIMGGETLQADFLYPVSEIFELESNFIDWLGVGAELASLLTQLYGLSSVAVGFPYQLVKGLQYVSSANISLAEVESIIAATAKEHGVVIQFYNDVFPEWAPSFAKGFHEVKDGVHHIGMKILNRYFLEHELGHVVKGGLDSTKEYWTNVKAARASEMNADYYAYKALKAAGDTLGAFIAYSRYLLGKVWIHPTLEAFLFWGRSVNMEVGVLPLVMPEEFLKPEFWQILPGQGTGPVSN